MQADAVTGVAAPAAAVEVQAAAVAEAVLVAEEPEEAFKDVMKK